ncbi:MAG: cobalt ECF transporter T component CbiQ [Treponema sp.]|nr:cobalt ECF transporter T component CbiQ [Treponema sp.]
MQDSPVHALHPAAKIITTLCYITVIVSFPQIQVRGLMIFFLYPAIILPLASLPLKPVMIRFLFCLPFALMGALSCLFFQREPLFYIYGLAVSGGMLAFVSILLKSLLSVTAVLILVASTGMDALSRGLAAMKVPRIFCLQLNLCYRYIGALVSEAFRMSTAYLLRCPYEKRIRMKDMGSFLGQLLLRSMERAERVYFAMKCRGFDGLYSGNTGRSFTPHDTVYTITVIFLALLFRFTDTAQRIGNLVRGLW